VEYLFRSDLERGIAVKELKGFIKIIFSRVFFRRLWMNKKFGLKLLALAVLLPALFVSCTKTGALTGNTSTSGGSATLTGSVSGGLSPVSGASISLLAAGSTTPLATAASAANGSFTLTYTNPGGNALLYLTAIGGNAGGGTNANIRLTTLLGAATSAPSSVAMSELTTAAFSEISFAFGLFQDTNGTVTYSAPLNAAGVTNIITQWNNILANGKLNTGNSNLTSGMQNILGTMANSLVSCVQTPANCTTLFNTAASSSSAAGLNMMDAISNMLNVTLDATPVYNLALPLAPGSGFSMSGSAPSALSMIMPTTSNTFTGTGMNSPIGLTVDSGGNIWVANQSGAQVVKFSSSGAFIGSFASGGSPQGIAIDAGGNVWAGNRGGGCNCVTEFTSSGTVVGSFSVGTQPDDVAIDAAGNIWVDNITTNNVTKLNQSGTTLGTFALPGGANPRGIAIDGSGNLWVVNTGLGSLSELSPSGATMNTIPGTAGFDLAFDQSGNLWYTASSTVVKINPFSGGTIGTYTTGGTGAFGMSIDGQGNVWVTNTAGASVLCELNTSGTLVGTYSTSGVTGGVITDSSGNVWMTNNNTNSITRLNNVTVGPTFFPYQGPQFSSNI
jgi:streptogramin lyase